MIAIFVRDVKMFKVRNFNFPYTALESIWHFVKILTVRQFFIVTPCGLHPSNVAMVCWWYYRR